MNFTKSTMTLGDALDAIARGHEAGTYSDETAVLLVRLILADHTTRALGGEA